jgi:hypothetical protein
MLIERSEWIDRYSVCHEFFTPSWRGVHVCIDVVGRIMSISYATRTHAKRFRRQGARFARKCRRIIQDEVNHVV